MKCCVPNCENEVRIKKSSFHRITFHSFPKDPNQRSAWVKSLKMDDWTPSNRSFVCSDHFKEEDFCNTKPGFRRVKAGVVPVLIEKPLVPVESRLCKICLTLDARMYDIRKFKLDKMYENITGILPRIDQAGRLTQRVCWECAARLSSASRFRDKVLLSDKLLQNLVDTHNCVTIGDIFKLQDKHKILKSSLFIQKLVSPIFEPFDSFKVETMQISPHNETQHEITNLVNETDEICVKGEDFDDIIEGCTSINTDPVKTEVDLIPITQIDVPVEDNDNFVFEDIHFDDNDVIPQTDNIEMIKIDQEETVNVKESSQEDMLYQDLMFDDQNNTVNDNVYVMQAVDEPIGDNDKIVEEPIVSLDRLKTGENKKYPARRKTAAKNNRASEKKGSKKQPYVTPSKPLDESVITVTPLEREQLIQEILNRKDSDKYNRSPFKCTVCYLGFPTKDKQVRHVLKHSEESGPLQCGICLIRMKLGRELRAHMKRAHTCEYSCKLCPFVTRMKPVAAGHVKFHAGSIYKCPHCEQEFEKQTTFLNHQRLKHMSDSVCDLCGYTFVGKYGVQTHKKLKHKFDRLNPQFEGPYCEVCDVKFFNQKAYDKHLGLSSKHIKSEDDPNRLSNDPSIKCRRIGRQHMKAVRRPAIRRRDAYAPRAHCEAPPGGPLTPVTCEQCGLQLANCRSYTHHFRGAHPGLNRTQFISKNIPYMCELCGKMFANTTTLAGHMWVHTGEKRFQCEHCSKTFSTKSNIAIHMVQHQPRRRSYECAVCGKQFLFLHNRNRHMFLHTGVKPFQCDVCEKGFPTVGELRAHVDHVHLKKPRPKRRRNQKRDVTNAEY